MFYHGLDGLRSQLGYALALPFKFFKKKFFKGDDDFRDFQERRGFYAKGLPVGSRVFWVYSCSSGEIQASASFLDEMQKEFEGVVVLSTDNMEGQRFVDKYGIKCDLRISQPFEAPSVVRRAVDFVAPEVFVAFEAGVCPVLLRELKSRGVPCFLLNGRLSDTNMDNNVRKIAKRDELYSFFDLITARTEDDRNYLLGLGIADEKIVVTGDSKADTLIEEFKRCDLRGMTSRLNVGDSKVFLAGSTHNGEDEVVLEAFEAIRKKVSGVRLVIVPRNVSRARSVSSAALEYGKVVLYSQLLSGDSDWDILVVDQLGILFELYGICDACFIGGSLVLKGGHNIMEPAVFGKPVAYGPDMRDFKEPTERLTELGVAFEVKDAEELAEVWEKSLLPEVRQRAMEGGKRYFDSVGEAGGRSWKAVREYMKERAIL